MDKSNKKIAEWDFSKLPEDEHAAAYKSAKAMKGYALRVMHEKYELSPHVYCCGDDDLAVVAYFLEAIRLGYIETPAEYINAK